MSPENLWQYSVPELAGLLASGELAADALLRACLERCEKLDPALNAIVHLDRDGAMAAAQRTVQRQRAGRLLGPLDGIPVTVKDNLFVAGMPATWGSALYRDHVAERDDIAVERLRAAGAVILGKTNTPEFALSGRTDNRVFGVTRNPWDLSLNPGGSSGGAVAAVAAGLAPLALATDAGGSIRLPACFTGLVGLRPSTGRVARRYGFPPMALDFQVVGPIARTVRELELFYRCIAGPDARDPASLRFPPSHPASARRLRLALSAGGEPVDPEVRANVRRAANVLAELGYEVDEGDVPYDLEAVRSVWGTLSSAGAARAALAFADRSELTESVAAAVDAGMKITATQYVSALDRLAGIRASVSENWSGFDLLVTPTAACPAWPVDRAFPETVDGRPGHIRSAAIFTTWVNACGLPAITVPVEPAADGRPIGMQIVGPFGAEDELFALAHRFEAARPWATHWPKIALSGATPDRH